MKRVYLITVVIGLAAMGILAAGGAFAQDTLEEVLEDPDALSGEKTASEFTMAIITRLEGETLEESFDNIEYVNDYYEPGFSSGYGIAGPFDKYVRVVLSNRRFAKLLEGLKGLDPDTRHALLEKHFKRLLAQYEEMLSRFLIVNKPVPLDFVVLLRIGTAEGDAPTAHGTRHSLRAIALLSGILGDEKMWPLLREAFKHPLCGLEIDEVQYIEGAREEMSDHPVFCEGIQAQVVHLFASSLDDKKAADVGFKRNDALEVLAEFRQAQEAKAAADENPLRRRYLYNVTKKIVIPNYQARAISYDERSGEVDLFHGYNEVEFLVTEDEEFFARMVKAATPSGVGLETP